ncbi:hypothetical protein E2C01_084337 [Portunus trituberculatus]|uniref:Uncharacterized protein n=1 Tax=Portunus trituberculatus TaxID=210409 RepID=A0A5B7IZP1_PORTR|nr:hypothetical protein [Portunus trituberculatus]
MDRGKRRHSGNRMQCDKRDKGGVGDTKAAPQPLLLLGGFLPCIGPSLPAC